MKPPILMLCAAAAMPLAGCASTYGNDTLGYAGTGAAIGAAGGAGVAALAGGDMLAGALIGGAVGGIAGAVWADRDRDGRVDGYVREGQYYEGAPPSHNYQNASAAPQCRSVPGTAATGAAIGAAGGAVIGALAGGPLAGALIGAAVGGVSGAVWADANNDGCVDGYVREGRYYEGAPPASYQEPAYSQPTYQPVGYRRGERG